MNDRIKGFIVGIVFTIFIVGVVFLFAHGYLVAR